MEYIEIKFKKNEINVKFECTQYHRLIAILELLKGMEKESYNAAQNILYTGKQLYNLTKENKK